MIFLHVRDNELEADLFLYRRKQREQVDPLQSTTTILDEVVPLLLILT